MGTISQLVIDEARDNPIRNNYADIGIMDNYKMANGLKLTKF